MSSSPQRALLSAASVHLDTTPLGGIEETDETGVSQNSNRCEHGSSSDEVGVGPAALSAEQPRI
jgi:hypothetical protein